MVTMTVRLSISLPDELHDQLAQLAAASNVSIAAVTRAILSDVVPPMTTVLGYIGTLTPEQQRGVLPEIDRWERDAQALLERAPAPFDHYGRGSEGNSSADAEEAAEPAARDDRRESS